MESSLSLSNMSRYLSLLIIGIFLVWVIICIIVTLLIVFAFPNDSGINGYEWMPIAACIIAIIFGFILLCCCKINADRLSWRKRLLMYNVLEDIELLHLKNSPLGIRPGKEGAWIELGNLASVGRSHH